MAQLKISSYDGKLRIMGFKCIKCGGTEFYRHKSMYGLSFWEGHFHCRNCKNEAYYATDDFYEIIREKPGQQLSLF